MQVWPAIDVRDGKCVRLRQGDYDLETVFSDDPVEVAQRFQSEGARFLHLVDLDGARTGGLANLQVLERIVRSVDMVCEVGGGIREESAIQQLLDLGVDRLVVGTRAATDPDWLVNMSQTYPGKLVVGIDAKAGFVAIEGWERESQLAPTALARRFADLPLAAIIFTDIATDGMLAGPNLPAMKEMQEAVDLPVVASGGVTTEDDVAALATLPMAGVIIGRALYENKLTLREALAAASRAASAS